MACSTSVNSRESVDLLGLTARNWSTSRPFKVALLPTSERTDRSAPQRDRRPATSALPALPMDPGVTKSVGSNAPRVATAIGTWPSRVAWPDSSTAAMHVASTGGIAAAADAPFLQRANVTLPHWTCNGCAAPRAIDRADVELGSSALYETAYSGSSAVATSESLEVAANTRPAVFCVGDPDFTRDLMETRPVMHTEAEVVGSAQAVTLDWDLSSPIKTVLLDAAIVIAIAGLVDDGIDTH